jgi:hypothetical protein
MDVLPPVLQQLEPFVEERVHLGKEQFLTRHADPVLLVRLGQAGLDDDALRTQAVPAAGLPRGPGFEMVVVPVVKRTHDAFRDFIWVGRSSRCDVVLPFESISKLQAQISRGPQGFRILDVGSTNGTEVDGVRLEKNKPVPVPDGATLKFGQVRTRFCSPERFEAEVELIAKLRR